MENLRSMFKYDEKGEPDIYSYGAFKNGVTNEEIDNYLRVRTGQFNVKVQRKFFNKVSGCNTVAVWNGLVDVGNSLQGSKYVPGSVILHYRSDVKRFADRSLLGKGTYFD